MMVTWSCGCTGLLLTVDGQRQAWVIDGCDARDPTDNPNLWERPHNLGKMFTPMTAEAAGQALKALSRLINDGHRYRSLRSLLQIPPREECLPR